MPIGFLRLHAVAQQYRQPPQAFPVGPFGSFPFRRLQLPKQLRGHGVIAMLHRQEGDDAILLVHLPEQIVHIGKAHRVLHRRFLEPGVVQQALFLRLRQVREAVQGLGALQLGPEFPEPQVGHRIHIVDPRDDDVIGGEPHVGGIPHQGAVAVGLRVGEKL